MAGRGGNRGGRAPGGPNMGNLLNLERVPMLAPKFANKIGKTCDGYAVIYTGSGVEVQVRTKIGPNGRPLSPPAANAAYPMITLMEFERRVALANQPTADEKLAALRRKYELRLKREFPANGPASGSDADIQAWLGMRPFAERLALLMSQKDFEKSYPEGFRA